MYIEVWYYQIDFLSSRQSLRMFIEVLYYAKEQGRLKGKIPLVQVAILAPHAICRLDILGQLPHGGVWGALSRENL